MRPLLHVLGGGAAQGVVDRLQSAFEQLHGASVQGSFGAVGAMRDRLLAGEPADVVVLSAELIRQLQADGRLQAGSDGSLGFVETGVAVPDGAAMPAIGTSARWREALAGCTGFYVPDMSRSTAGRHVAAMLGELGLLDSLGGRLHEFANGQTAMAALASAGDTSALGCTQVTEILNTPGVTLVGPLPAAHRLATEYVAAITAGTAFPSLAAALVRQLTGPESAALRRSRGFLSTPAGQDRHPPRDSSS